MIDLHRHLEGSVRAETVLELVKEYNLPFPKTLEALLPKIRVVGKEKDLMQFLAKMDNSVAILQEYSVCERIAYEAVEDAAKEGLVYLELRFSPFYMAMHHNLQMEGVVEAVIEGVSQAEKDFGLKTNLIGILSRTFGVEATTKELQALLAYKEKITALDMAGAEVGFPAILFEKQFKKAREVGWHITAHAGEEVGSESIWMAIHHLKAERIGHGVRAVEDPKLMDYVKEHKIGIESTLTSNVQTATVTDYKQHPLKMFLEHGILATINTDDPSVSGINLPYELTVAAPKAGLTPEMVRQAQRNSIEIAFLSEKEKEDLRMKMPLCNICFPLQNDYIMGVWPVVAKK